MTRVYLALGSNLSDPLKQVKSAIKELMTIPNTIIVATSSMYRTPPYGPKEQPDFLNVAVALDSSLEAEILLNYTQLIEESHGRVYKAHRWGARKLDIDIMLFGMQMYSTPRLTIPHYDMHNRAFMLLPLLEIVPDLYLPNGIPLSVLISKLDTQNINLW